MQKQPVRMEDGPWGIEEPGLLSRSRCSYVTR